MADIESTSGVELFPAGAQMRLCSIAMALDGAIELANEAGDHKVLGILDLVRADLTRMTGEFDELATRSVGAAAATMALNALAL